MRRVRERDFVAHPVLTVALLHRSRLACRTALKGSEFVLVASVDEDVG